MTCSVLSTTPGHGLGIEFTYHDPEVVARGNAGVASADGASAVYYNPAMLGTGDGSELLLAGYVLDYHIEHDGPGGHSEMEDGPAVAASAFAMTPLGEKVSLEGDGHGWGLGAGFTWEPSEHHRIGGTVRYWSPVKYKGHTTTRLLFPAPGNSVAPAETELDFPVEATLGYAWTPDPKWLVEVDVTYTGWSSFDDFQISSPGGNLVEPLRWEDTLTYQFGYGNSREITGGLPTLSGSVADGKMTYRAHGLSMGARWFF